MHKVIYCATPSRLIHEDSTIVTQIMDYVRDRGHYPLHPFQALPWDYWEGHPKIDHSQARPDSMKVCMGLVDLSNELWVFGPSNGVIQEARYAKQLLHNPAKQTFEKISFEHLDQFDPFWNGHVKNLDSERIDQWTELYQDRKHLHR